MDRVKLSAIVAAAVTGAGPSFAFPPPTTADPINTYQATIGTNYNQVQTYSADIGYNVNTFVQNPDVLWYKYVSDGQSAVRFDTLNSNITTGSGGGFTLPSSNETQVAVYTASGSIVALSKNTVNLNGDPMAIYPTFSSDKGTAVGSGLGVNQYTPEELSQLYLAPTTSTNPHWSADPYSTTYYAGWAAPGNEGNSQHYYQPDYPTNLNEYHVWSTALSTVMLDNNGNPVLSGGTPRSQPGWRYSDYARVGPASTWNRYQTLPAGTYYIAVASVSPTLAGDTYTQAVLEAPIHYDANANVNNVPILTGPLGTWQYYLDSSTSSFAGTIELDVTQAPVQTQTIATLNGSANMTLNATTLVVTNGGTYGGTLQDGTFQGLLVLTGGTLTLTANNTLSGGITLAGGELSVASDAFLGDPTQSLTFAGGTLGITGTTDNTTARPIYWTSAGGGFDIADPANIYTTAAVLTGGGLTKTGAGTLVLTKAYTTTSPTIIAAGTLQFSPATGTTMPANNSVVGGITGGGNVTIASGASLVSDGIAVNTLSIANSVQIRTNGTSSGTSKLGSLILAGAANAWTGGLDITNNKLILQATPGSKATAIATLQNEVAFGKTHTAGVYSSASLPANLALAVIDNAALSTPKTTFGGLSVDGNSILVGAELLGDANADGHVDLTDLSTVLNNFGTTTSAWTSGNFDSAATIDLTDLSDVLNNFGLSYANASDALAAPAIVATPEPASLALTGIGALALLSRRRKN